MTNAELFTIAANPVTSRDAFLSNVTLSAPDSPGYIDLDAEKARLSRIWEMAHLSMKELISLTGLSQTAFAKAGGRPAAHRAGLVRRKACVPHIRPLFAGRAL